MTSKETFSLRAVLAAISLLVITGAFSIAQAATLTQEEQLGKLLYFDENLSNPVGQSCASCHLPTAGFADPDRKLPVSEGAVPGRFGGRNAPSAAYAAYSPVFHWDKASGLYIGGQFWDGRAPDLAAQAKGPFLNPVEMNNTKGGVVTAVRNSNYADLFKKVYGFKSLNNVDSAYNLIAKAIAAYEKTTEVNQFSSKYDLYLKGQVKLTAQETRGLLLFNGKGNCAACHPSESADGITPPLFTDFSYDNLGVPRNMEFPFHSMVPSPYPDLGLGAALPKPNPNEYGKFKVMSLRNIAETAPYSHNGYFKTLKDIVHFYNTRDVLAWPDPADYPDTVNNTELGNLGLTAQEESDIVAFLQTLTDGYLVK